MRRRALRSRKRLASSPSAENSRVRFHSLTCSTLPTPPVPAAQRVLTAPADTERLGDLFFDAFAILEVEVASVDTA
jgi:hypothetical protein